MPNTQADTALEVTVETCLEACPACEGTGSFEFYASSWSKEPCGTETCGECRGSGVQS